MYIYVLVIERLVCYAMYNVYIYICTSNRDTGLLGNI